MINKLRTKSQKETPPAASVASHNPQQISRFFCGISCVHGPGNHEAKHSSPWSSYICSQHRKGKTMKRDLAGSSPSKMCMTTTYLSPPLVAPRMCPSSLIFPSAATGTVRGRGVVMADVLADDEEGRQLSSEWFSSHDSRTMLLTACDGRRSSLTQEW